MRDSGDVKKYPALRPDIKFSKQTQGGRVKFVVKDPLKDKFYRFDKSEWEIIELFDGKHTAEDIVSVFNHTHRYDEIDLDLVEEYRSSLESMDLLEKSRQEHNVMLIEKMKEMRSSQLLSKKGSILYKRFPVVDPDKFFDRIIDSVRFFWTKKFLFLSLSIMLLAILIVASNWTEFNNGMREAFAFKEMSIWNFIFLWGVVYIVIAIHEVGHGLTCKHFGGEVHEIGFLLLFFQPCLYCNVNDAWLFDKKHKQILVTLAGGYIEFLIGAICCIIWFVTNPNTVINVLAFQVMTVCSVATVFFNFNPLIKLDGYYLLADYLELPNLRDRSGDYLKYVVCRYIFRMPEEPFVASKREKRIYFLYGLGSSLWIFFLLTGIFFLVQGLLIDSLYEIGLLISLFIAYKLFSGQFVSAGKFLLKWYMTKKAIFDNPKVKKTLAFTGVVLFALLFIPQKYTIPAHCTLQPSFVEVLRLKSDGVVSQFYKQDGDIVAPQEKIAQIINPLVLTERNVASQAVDKAVKKFRQSLVKEGLPRLALRQEIEQKKMNLAKKDEIFDSLELRYNGDSGKNGLVSCTDSTRMINTRIKKGEEVCRVLGIDKLRAIIEVSEQQVGFVKLEDEVEFKIKSLPFHTFTGQVHRIHVEGVADPKNPKAKKYNVELLIDNGGELKPGMNGKAKILTERVTTFTFLFRKLATFFRMDLFV